MRIILLLGLLGCSPTDEDIARNLSAPNVVVREDTAKIARNFGSDAVVTALLGALADPSPTVRRNAVDSLAELEAKQAAQPLAAMLATEADPLVQRQIVDALGRLKDPETVPALVSWLEAREADPPLNAIWALGNIGDARALDLLSRLRGSADPYVVYNCTLALRLLRG